ncbi:hypothetical protein HELRODRAFT_170473 [Helobdella robusta]|uniref:Uncharacterized protein n=1 Tax=Helobdella robusta TaxID=6412 RepID=T1F338_HELRO|nr:hypothetical protein HELRODRAFT_170473 [Helobdella robusta]ESO07164.1 hypothetical protein HELRODRAFT_170473 [Helobdella robusta]
MEGLHREIYAPEMIAILNSKLVSAGINNIYQHLNNFNENVNPIQHLPTEVFHASYKHQYKYIFMNSNKIFFFNFFSSPQLSVDSCDMIMFKNESTWIDML